MIKQSLIYLLLSLLIVIFAKYAHLLLVYIDIVYSYVNVKLTPLFSTSEAGILLRGIITLTTLPICITAIPALAYYAFKHTRLPYYFEATWIIWLIIVISKIIIQ